MGKLIILDAGHGMTTSGKRSPTLPEELKSETGNFMHENEFNRAVVIKLDKKLRDCGFDTLTVSSLSTDTPLKTRVDLANSKKADAFISIHANAFDGKFNGKDLEGVETYHFPNSAEGKKLAESVHKYLVKGTKQVDRGVKSSDFQVLRDTKMPAILIEAGFMDNLYEVKLLLNDKFREEVATEIAQGVCDYFKVPFFTEKDQTTELYRVRASWEDSASQKGAFSSLDKAIELTKTLSGYKVYNLKGEQVFPSKDLDVENPVKEILNPIMGNSVARAEQMSKMLISKNPSPKIGISALAFAEIFLEEGAKEGVTGDKAFCQAMHETGWLKFGGQVLPEQHNYSGIGATNNSPVGKGAWFTSEREGIRAQIQHLKAYASKEPLKTDCVDPRFHLVTRGIAPSWTDLNGRWAVPGTNYGQSILALHEELLKVKVEIESEKVTSSETTLKEEIQKKNSEIEQLKLELSSVNKKLTDIKFIVN